MIVCPECGFENRDDIKYCQRCNRYIGSVKPVEHDININISPSSPTVECPYCKSTATQKITATSKVVNTVVWGIFGTKRHKNYHCSNCKSDF